jgi:uncharacterized protein YnzC (UPF0291/DUF896 family)
MMDQNKLTRLNVLFEKVVSDKANVNEQRELKALYQEYINEGRECLQVQETSHYHHATA